MKPEQIQLIKDALGDLKTGLETLEMIDLSGSSPATGSRSRVAVEEPGAHDKPTPQLARSRTEGRVKLQRLVDQLTIEADGELMDFDDWEKKHDKNGEGFNPMPAVEKLECAAVLSALLSETQTESVAGEMEECPQCKSDHIRITIKSGRCKCIDCGNVWTRGKDRERLEEEDGEEQRSVDDRRCPDRRVRTLILPLKRRWFEDVKAGTKTEEYRLENDYWTKRLVGKNYDRIVITLGYPKRDDTERRIPFRYRGFKRRVITSEEWGNEPQKVFAISLEGPESGKERVASRGNAESIHPVTPEKSES